MPSRLPPPFETPTRIIILQLSALQPRLPSTLALHCYPCPPPLHLPWEAHRWAFGGNGIFRSNICHGTMPKARSRDKSPSVTRNGRFAMANVPSH